MKKIKSKIIKFFLIFSTAFLLSGCWDKREMEDRSYVITMGIDAYLGLEDYRYTICFGPAQLSALAGTKEGGTENSGGVTVHAKTIAEAIRQANCSSSRQMYLGQLKTVVLGKSMLEKKELLSGALDELERNQEISPKTIILSTVEKAVDCVFTILKEDGSTGLFIWDFYKNTASDVAVTERLSLETLLQELRQNEGDTILPKITLRDEKIYIGGGILLNDYAFVAALSNEEEQGALFTKGKASGAVLHANWEGNTAPLWVIENNQEISFWEEEDKVIVFIKSLSKGSVLGNDFLARSIFDDVSIKKLEKEYEKIIKAEIENTIKLVQQEYQSDAFGLKNELRRQNKKLYDKYLSNGENIFDVIEIRTEANMNIRTTGVIQ